VFRYQVGFSGDVDFGDNGWAALAFQPYFTATASNILHGYWSHDIIGPGNDDELETRWLQWGALSPINRLHDRGMGTGSCVETSACYEYAFDYDGNDVKNHPAVKDPSSCQQLCVNNDNCRYFSVNGGSGCWLKSSMAGRTTRTGVISGPKYCPAGTQNSCSPIDLTLHPEENLAIELKALRLRSELLPYFYNLMREATLTGISMMRPLYYEHPTVDEAYVYLNEYYLGNDMLIAPIVNASTGTGKMVSYPIWLPEGKYYDVVGGKVTDGNAVLSRDYDLSDVPIFVKAGAIIPKLWVEGNMYTPANFPNRGHWIGTAAEQYANLNFEIYPGADSGTTTVYEDDGMSMDYADHNLLTSASYDTKGDSVTVNLSPKGNGFDGMVETRGIIVTLVNSAPATSVTCNDQPGEFYYDGETFSAVVYCGEQDVKNSLTIVIQRASAPSDMHNIAARVMTARCAISKLNLDFANINYGTNRGSLTRCAVAGTTISADPSQFSTVLTQLTGWYTEAKKEVNNCDYGFGARKERSAALLSDL